MKKLFILQHHSSGSILVETLVAVALVMLAVPAALTVASKSISLASYSKQQVIATYLAQEGLEIIRNRRDENMIKILAGDTSVTWTSGFYGPPGGICGPGAGVRCRVDYGVSPRTDPLIQRCTGSCPLVLCKNTSDGTYAHPTGATCTAPWMTTPFSRYVQVSNIPGGNLDERRVTSVVTYTIYGVTKSISLSEGLTKWIQ